MCLKSSIIIIIIAIDKVLFVTPYKNNCGFVLNQKVVAYL